MQFIDGAAYFPENGVLAVADLHIGYEAELRAKGAYLPTQEVAMLRKRLSRILARTKPRVVVVNGDFKHSFGRVSDGEWRGAKQVLKLLGDGREVVLVIGNHDPVLFPIAKKYGVQTAKEYRVGDTLFVHGDNLPETTESYERVVIGHEHPAITISDGVREELVKCYLVGSWEDKELVVLPSMFSLTEGTDVLSERLMSPFLLDVSSFTVHALVNGEALAFGTVEDVRGIRD